jgi:hypothetical protein
MCNTNGSGTDDILRFSGKISDPVTSSTSRNVPPTQGTKLSTSNPIKMDHSDFFRFIKAKSIARSVWPDLAARVGGD